MGYHLSVPVITCRDRSAYPGSVRLHRESNEQFSNDPLRGISACKVYPLMMLPSKAVSSYLTFSSFPRRVVIFCGTVCSPRPVGRTRLLTGALLCTVRTFLPDKIGTIAWLVAPKESFGLNLKERITKIITDCRIKRFKIIFMIPAFTARLSFCCVALFSVL